MHLGDVMHFYISHKVMHFYISPVNDSDVACYCVFLAFVRKIMYFACCLQHWFLHN